MNAMRLTAGGRVWSLHYPCLGVQAVEVVHWPRWDPVHLCLPIALVISGQGKASLNRGEQLQLHPFKQRRPYGKTIATLAQGIGPNSPDLCVLQGSEEKVWHETHPENPASTIAGLDPKSPQSGFSAPPSAIVEWVSSD
jgi:hypothetical protein